VYSEPDAAFIEENPSTPFGMILLYRDRELALLKELRNTFCRED
jgi:hypothetical protein